MQVHNKKVSLSKEGWLNVIRSKSYSWMSMCSESEFERRLKEMEEELKGQEKVEFGYPHLIFKISHR